MDESGGRRGPWILLVLVWNIDLHVAQHSVFQIRGRHNAENVKGYFKHNDSHNLPVPHLIPVLRLASQTNLKNDIILAMPMQNSIKHGECPRELKHKMKTLRTWKGVRGITAERRPRGRVNVANSGRTLGMRLLA